MSGCGQQRSPFGWSDAAIEAVAAELRERLRRPFDPYEVTAYILDALEAPMSDTVTVSKHDLLALVRLADEPDSVPAGILDALDLPEGPRGDYGTQRNPVTRAQSAALPIAPPGEKQ